MSKLFFISVAAFLYFTYKLITVTKNKEAPTGNKKIAWSLYSILVLGLIIANIYYEMNF